MKIIHINEVYGYGSTGIIVKDIQKACAVNSIDCVVAYTNALGEVQKGYHIGNKCLNKIHGLLSRISGKQGYFSYISTWKLLRYLDSFKPDIAHLHNLHGCFINLPMLLKYLSKKNIPTVVSLHDCWFYTGGCTHYTAVGCNKWLEHCGNCPKRYEEFPALILDSSRKQLEDRVNLFGNIKNLTAVGVSQWIVDEAQKKVFKTARCLAIRNGIDLNFFHPVESDFRKKYNLEGKFVILAPANKWFLPVNKETFDVISSSLDEDTFIVFIGSGVKKEMLKPNMISLGFIKSREEIREIYSSADVMINCTREESLSLLNVEVQACGTPVITYSNTGVKETVDGKCGYAVENGNPKALLNKLKLIKSAGKSSYLINCIRWVNEEFDLNKNYIKFIDLYKDIYNQK